MDSNLIPSRLKSESLTTKPPLPRGLLTQFDLICLFKHFCSKINRWRVVSALTVWDPLVVTNDPSVWGLYVLQTVFSPPNCSTLVTQVQTFIKLLSPKLNLVVKANSTEKSLRYRPGVQEQEGTTTVTTGNTMT